MRVRRRYDEKFRASALVMLESTGYPNRQGGIVQTAKHLGMPESTLRAWWNGSRNPVPAEERAEKRQDLSDMLRTELNAILGDMPNARQDASYRDMGTVAGILFDKLQLLTQQPTERTDSVIRVVRDAGIPNTFSNPAPWTGSGYQKPKTVQRPGNGAAMGENGSWAKPSN